MGGGTKTRDTVGEATGKEEAGGGTGQVMNPGQPTGEPVASLERSRMCSRRCTGAESVEEESAGTNGARGGRGGPTGGAKGGLERSTNPSPGTNCRQDGVQGVAQNGYKHL